jgi:hypothetical protein
MLDSDTGIGLSATDADQLFVPFQQADVCKIHKQSIQYLTIH